MVEGGGAGWPAVVQSGWEERKQAQNVYLLDLQTFGCKGNKKEAIRVRHRSEESFVLPFQLGKAWM